VGPLSLPLPFWHPGSRHKCLLHHILSSWHAVFGPLDLGMEPPKP
jgi:hypothetical protein